jgi:hypothetical protein
MLTLYASAVVAWTLSEQDANARCRRGRHAGAITAGARTNDIRAALDGIGIALGCVRASGIRCHLLELMSRSKSFDKRGRP